MLEYHVFTKSIITQHFTDQVVNNHRLNILTTFQKAVLDVYFYAFSTQNHCNNLLISHSAFFMTQFLTRRMCSCRRGLPAKTKHVYKMQILQGCIQYRIKALTFSTLTKTCWISNLSQLRESSWISQHQALHGMCRNSDYFKVKRLMFSLKFIGLNTKEWYMWSIKSVTFYTRKNVFPDEFGYHILYYALLLFKFEGDLQWDTWRRHRLPMIEYLIWKHRVFVRSFTSYSQPLCCVPCLSG